MVEGARMTLEIWKHKLPKEGLNSILLPKNCSVTSVQNQNEELVLWEIHYEENAKELVPKTFYVIPTGTKFDVPRFGYLNFFGTVQFTNREYVLHVYGVVQ